MARGTPPAYVFAVLANRVLIGGDVARLYSLILRAGYRDRLSRETASTLALQWIPDCEDHLADRSLHSTLRWLIDNGVAFAESRSPERCMATLARELQRSGALPARLRTIEWMNQDEWKVKDQQVRPGSAPTAPS